VRSLYLRAVLALAAISCGNKNAGEWAAVTDDSIIVGVEISGSLKATHSISVGPPPLENIWEFKIAALAPEGDVVKEGDMLVAFDSSDLDDQRVTRINQRESALVALQKQQVEIKLANQDSALKLVEAEAAVRKATLNADQSAELTASLSIAKAKVDLDAAIENVEYLKAQAKRKKASDRGVLATLQGRVDLATHQVEQLDHDIESMTIEATTGGTIIYGDNWGTKTKVGASLWRLATAVEVASLDSMMAEAIIDEADSAKLSLGQTVHLRLESEPDQEVIGTLTEIETTVHQKSQTIPTQVVSVKLSIESSGDLKLRPGMRFRGEVEIERLEHVVVIPLAAIFPSPEGPVAYVKTSDGAERRTLVLGKRGKRGVEVQKGLTSGDRVSRIDLSATETGGSSL